MTFKELIKFIENILCQSYGETLREYDTAKLMATELAKKLKRKGLLSNDI